MAETTLEGRVKALMLGLEKGTLQLNPDSSPGFPSMKFGQSTKDVFKALGADRIVRMAAARLHLLDMIPLEKLMELPAIERALCGIAGVNRVFVKNEPHTKQKLAEGRERIIYNLDLVSLVCEHALLDKQYNAEKSAFGSGAQIPATNGMGNHDEGIEFIRGRMDRMSDKVTTDITGWDNSVPHQLGLIEAKRLQISMRIPRFENLVTKTFENLGVAVTLLPGGVMTVQELKGGTKSGSLTTSQSGSAKRAMTSMLAFNDDALNVMTHGDDCCEETRGSTPEELVAAYLKLGFRVKEQQRGNDLEYCGLRRVGRPIPLKPYKMLYHFFQEVGKDRTPFERFEQLTYELRNHPDLDSFVELIHEVVSGIRA